MNRIKKFLTILLCVTMVLSMFPSISAFAESDDLKSDVAGDVNGDGRLDGADLVRLKKYVSGNPVSIAYNCADVDASGGVNADDLTLLSEYMAGIATSLATPDPSGVILAYSEPEEEHVVMDETGQYYVDNRLLITAEYDVSMSQVEQLIQQYNGKIVSCISVTNDYEVELPAPLNKAELESIVNELNQSDLVELALLDFLYETGSAYIPNDPLWSNVAWCDWNSEYPGGENWGVEAIHAPKAWDYLARMKPVNVGIIDSDFNKHEDVSFAKVWNNTGTINRGSKHGMHVAGTIGATFNNGVGIAGIAPTSKLYAFAVDGKKSVYDENSSFVGFMEWKYAASRLLVSGCRVINVSWVWGSDIPMQQRVFGSFLTKMLNNGYDFLFVQSAGNSSSDAASSAGLFSCVDIPAISDRVIVVGAIGNNGSTTNAIFSWFKDHIFHGYYYADFSNYGSRVDVVAPGVDIFSTIGTNGYENVYWDSLDWSFHAHSGTSMAAPHVTGVAAMCFAVNPSLNGAQVKDIIVNSCTETVTDNNKGHLDCRMYGVLNAYEAVKKAIGTSGSYNPIIQSNSILSGYVTAEGGYTLPRVNVSAYTVTGDGRTTFCASTVADEQGNFEIVLPGGTYHVVVSAPYYLDHVSGNIELSDNDVVYLENITLVRDTGSSGNVEGIVCNALTNNGISGVTVRLRAGWNNRTGQLATIADGNLEAVTQTSDEGRFSVSLKPGNYTVELTKEGYVTGYTNVVCSSSGAIQECVISPALSDNEYRIVLTWGETPSDLDSHISGPLSDSSIFHVYYGDMNAYDGDLTTAMLDIDDTTSYGPETVTLTCTQNGVYRYSVHDYTNRSSTSSKELSTSGAKVQVYCGNNLIKTYNVPNNKEGTVWNVFEIEDGVIRNINTMEMQEEPSLVAMSLGEIEAASVGILIRSPLKDYELMEDIEELNEDEPEETQEPEQLPEEPVEETSEPSEEQMQPEEPRELPELPVEEISDQPEDQITPEEPVEQHDELVPDEALSEGKVPEELEAPELEMELEPTVQDEIDWQIETDNKMVMDEIVQAEGEEVSQG